jgi:hypothetical protein
VTAHHIELLWFADCPNHDPARELLRSVVDALAPGTPILDIDATDAVVAGAHRFPGSPTIRVDGVDIQPGFVDPGDYTPRCRVYWTDAGLRGLPDRRWIEAALGTPVVVRPDAERLAPSAEAHEPA